MKKKLLWTIVALLALAVVVLIATWPRYLPIIRMHGEPPEFRSFEEMVNRAELIVLADIKSVKQGPDYVSPIIGTSSTEHYPTQRITLEVVKIYKGEVAQGQTVTLYQEGVGVTWSRDHAGGLPHFIINENDPVYERGERYILMLWPVPIGEEIKPYQPEPWQKGMFSVVYPEGRLRLNADGTVTSVLDSFGTNGKTLEEIEAMIAASTGEPPPMPAATGHVVYGLSGTLDGKPLPALVGIKAESCYDGYGGYTLTFAATADMEPQAIDDELGLNLEISIADISQITVGKPMQVANNQNIRLAARPTAFLPPESLGTLTTASGTLTIAALTEREISGSASLTFSDPDDVNAMVKDLLAYEVTFSNLAVIHFCPEPTPMDIQFVLNDTYKVGETIQVKIQNFGQVSYFYNQYYAACELSYFDASGRKFLIPPGTHCDLVAYVEIKPGETRALFEWDLSECIEDQWGCVKSQPLPEGTYTIQGAFHTSPEGSSTAIAEATIEIIND